MCGDGVAQIRGEKNSMNQYCRYCVFLTVNNYPYCNKKCKAISYSSCKRMNKCKDFAFVDCPSEFQDALGETNGYKPRERKMKEVDGQMNLFE